MNEPVEFLDGIHTSEQWEEMKKAIDASPGGLMFNCNDKSHHLHVVGCTKGFFEITCVNPRKLKSHMEGRVFFPGPNPWLQFEEWRESNGIERYKRPCVCPMCKKIQKRP